MTKRALLFALTIFLSLALRAQNFTPVKFSEFENFISSNKTDTLYVINFWATWCGPCIEELPWFEKLNAETKADKIKVILVSVDTESRWKSSLDPFLLKKNIQSDVMSFYNDKPIDWIDKISPEWNGSIPGTLFLYKGDKTFYEKEFTYEELHNIIQQLKI